jgi:tetratricopeptide (TPR) repeat protein
MLPDDVTGSELDEVARGELRTLPKDLATRVARHLVMAGRLLDEDSAAAYSHARAARRLASRVGVVREACGLAAYHAGEWSDALAELRAARRLAGREDAYLAVMADCERGLGRPERALDIAKSPDLKKLEHEERIEMRLVESGARRDLGQYDAAVVALQIPELKDKRLRPWSARLFYAYADALLDAGREDEARDWFARAAAADREGETDAAERHAELEGLEIIETELADPTAEGSDAQGAATDVDLTDAAEADVSSARDTAAEAPEAVDAPQAVDTVDVPDAEAAQATEEVSTSGSVAAAGPQPDAEAPATEGPDAAVIDVEVVDDDTQDTGRAS